MTEQEYTPTTDLIRHNWQAHGAPAAQFDRWLAERDRQVAERAWGEGFTQASRLIDNTEIHNAANPYRKTLND